MYYEYCAGQTPCKSKNTRTLHGGKGGGGYLPLRLRSKPNKRPGSPRPIRQHRPAQSALRALHMHLDQRPQTLLRLAINRIKPFSNNKLRVIPLTAHEGPVRVIHPRKSTRHPRPKVHPNAPQHHHNSPGHVLATVVAHTLDNSHSARIPDRKPFPCPSRRKQLPGGRAIQSNIAQNHMLPTVLRGKSTCPDHQFPTGESLTHKIIRLPLQHQLHPLDCKRTEGLSRN